MAESVSSEESVEGTEGALWSAQRGRNGCCRFEPKTPEVASDLGDTDGEK